MSDSTGPVVIVGSINMDLVVRTEHVPAPGETVLGHDFATIPGGKGANQAVAAARLGGQAIMIGRVGDDDFGQRLLAGLNENGVDTTHVLITPGQASGNAMIVVADNGENAITVASGANFQVRPEDVDAAEAILRSARVCVLQLELPVTTVARAIQICRQHGVETILDTAPIPPGGVPDELLQADIVTPNESETAQLTGLKPHEPPKATSDRLHARGCRTIVLKLGQRGAYVSAPPVETLVPGFPIRAVDTTAAGDAFTGALAVGRTRGWDLPKTVQFANAAGGLACTRLGAQPSMPTWKQVTDLIESQTHPRCP